MAPRVVLVGAPGAGKTTVGRLVAERLGLPFRDTDHDVEATAGKTVAEVFLDDGEVAFRVAEAAAVRSALDGYDGVLALGGGAVLDPATRAALAGQTVVQLEVGLTDASTRVGLSGVRPVLALNPRAVLKGLLDERAPLYAEVATAVVDTGGRTAEQVADAVLAAL